MHGTGPWRKSSFSEAESECVEVAVGADAVAVRDSKDPDGTRLVFPRGAWSAFLAVVRTSDFTRTRA